MFTKAQLNKFDEDKLVEIVSDLSDKLDQDLPTTGGKSSLIKVVLDNQVAAGEKAPDSSTGETVVKAIKTVQGVGYTILAGSTRPVPNTDLEELLEREFVVKI